MYKLIRPLLFKLFKDSETAHNLALAFLRLAGYSPIKEIISGFLKIENKILEQNVFGLNFKNPVGLAAGFDKDGKIVNGLESLGFGFLEIGTITKLPQSGNVRPRMFRLTEDEAIINRMGFNNEGYLEVKNYLKKNKSKIILGVSMGKNKNTPNELAVEDYLFLFKEMYNSGDYFVMNFSSPNTPGLRNLQDKKLLTSILEAMVDHRKTRGVYKPILIKIVIDFSYEAIDEILEVCSNVGVDGVISSNTSVSRDNLKTVTYEIGGLSGKPISKKSTELIKYIYRKVPNLRIVGAGGIFTAEDAYEKIKAGASLVQIYTGLIYEGPGLVKKINQGLVELLKRDGFKNISEAVGAEVK